MNTGKNIFHLLLVLLAVCTFAHLHAQTTNSKSWKKQVVRTVDVGKPDAYKRHSGKKDSSLTRMLYTDVMAKKLTAYQVFNNNLTDIATRDAVQDAVIPHTADDYGPDLMVPDPGTDKLDLDSLFATFHKYRILEDWTFDRATGTTDIKIVGIGPVKDITTNGGYSGEQCMFWVKYNDVKPQIARYDKGHMGHTLADVIWADYFKQGAKLVDRKIPGRNRNAHATRIISMDAEPDTAKHNFSNLNNDSAFYEIVDTKVTTGALAAYDSTGKKLTITELGKSTAHPDTIVDKANNTVRIIRHDRLSGHLPGFRVEEEWAFDPQDGHTTIKINNIAMRTEAKNGKGRIQNLYWLKFRDVLPVIAKFEERHPDRALALVLWDSYFYSDKKPKVLK